MSAIFLFHNETPSEQFAEIHIHENNKCAEAIHPTVPTSAQTQDGEIPITMKGDNQSSISLANNSVLHTRTKHIDIQHHYICDELASGRISLVYTPTGEMLADGLTKALSHVKFLNFIKINGDVVIDQLDYGGVLVE